MSTKIKYKGVTTLVSNNLFDEIKVTKKPPKKSNKFETPSLYYDGQYYFMSTLTTSNQYEDKPYKLDVVWYSGKWRSDVYHITEEFKNYLYKYV